SSRASLLRQQHACRTQRVNELESRALSRSYRDAYRRRMRLRFVAISLLAAASAHAQSVTTGAIAGTVTDEQTGEALPGVFVTVAGQSAMTDEHGAYKVTELVPGTYDVTFDLDPTHATHTGVVVSVAGTVTLDEKLKLGEHIEIHGPPPAIDLWHHS